MTPTPTPTPSPGDVDLAAPGGWWLVAALGLLLLMGGGLITAIMLAARINPETSMLTTVLAVLAVLLVGLYAIFGDSRGDLVPLASAVIGALTVRLADTSKGVGFRDTP